MPCRAWPNSWNRVRASSGDSSAGSLPPVGASPSPRLPTVPVGLKVLVCCLLSGFPTLGVRHGPQLFLVTSGYVTDDVLEYRLAEIDRLAQRKAAAG